MSYRSVKRVLGETSLERKCRILFGASLLLLITAAFWYAANTAEELVNDSPRQTGQFFVDATLKYYHFSYVWNQREEFAKAAAEMYEDLSTQNYQWQILTPTLEGVREDGKISERRTRLSRNREEREILADLAARLEERFEKHGRPPPFAAEYAIPDADAEMEPATSQAGSQADGETAGADDQLDVHPALRRPLARLETKPEAYHYYQVVFWKPSCVAFCHRVAQDAYVSAPETWAAMGKPPVLRVMKVVIPSGPTRDKILETRAILSAIAIATVFLSMVALYIVVRYVIVKPLQHLRNVSDEIVSGNHDVRANIQTNDEFEDLAESFNRMLRHLVDAQHELRSVNADLDAKVDQLAQANMQLHEMNRVKSDFLANMSHELRTPLNSIIGFADVLKENDSLNVRQKRYAANIATSGRALLDMINDILDLAKTESGKMEVRLAEFSIGPVVTTQCELLRSLSGEKNIDMTVDVQPGLPPLCQDQGKIQQILLNLLSNAIKFTPEGGRIDVSARRDERQQLVLTVADTGVGIADEDRQVIFEKFRQGNAGPGSNRLTREFSGTGLGLSIVKELCRLLGGEVSFDSDLGKGSTFTVTLPWTLTRRARLESALSTRLDEVTKPRGLDFGPPAAGASAPTGAGTEPPSLTAPQ